MTSPFPEEGSEFGGVGGLIQPAPHEPTAAEKLMINNEVRNSLDDSPENALRRLQDGTYDG